MTSYLLQIVNGLESLNEDIIEGVESVRVNKIPGWKTALVSFDEVISDFLLTALKFRQSYRRHEIAWKETMVKS